MAELNLEDLTPEEKAMLATSPAPLTKTQRSQIEASRAFTSWYESKDFDLSTASIALISDVMQQHALDPRQTANWQSCFDLLNDAGLLEAAPAKQEPAHQWTIAEVELLSSDEYKRHYFQTPGFAAQVDAFDEPKKPSLDGRHARRQ